MKKFSKITAMLLALIMVFALGSTALASTPTQTYTITITNSVVDETYTAYKIFDATYNGNAVAYTISTSSEWWNTVTNNNAGTAAAFNANGLRFTKTLVAGVYTVSQGPVAAIMDNSTTPATEVVPALTAADFDPAAFANLLDGAKSGKTKAAEATATATTLTLNVNPDVPGYYFVDTSLGSLCSLNTAKPNANIEEKNEVIPVPEKEVSDTEVQVGDVLEYTITMTDVKGTNLAATITDTMSKGLSFNNDAVLVASQYTKVDQATVTQPVSGTDYYTFDATNGVYVKAEGLTAWAANTDYFTKADTTLTAGNQYTQSVATDQTTGETTITWVISAAFMTSLNEHDTIVFTYHATVGEDASLDGTEQNAVAITYSNQHLDGIPVTVTFHDLTIDKTDGTNALKGAKFELYREGTPQVAVPLVQMTDAEALAALNAGNTGTQITTLPANTVFYKVVTAGTTGASNEIDMTQKDATTGELLYSSAHIFGLDADSKYYLTETVAPEGYNLLDEQVEVAAGANTVTVVNNAGSVLPSTGGIGTQIFTIVGAILIVCAGVTLIVRRRMERQ